MHVWDSAEVSNAIVHEGSNTRPAGTGAIFESLGNSSTIEFCTFNLNTVAHMMVLQS